MTPAGGTSLELVEPLDHLPLPVQLHCREGNFDGSTCHACYNYWAFRMVLKIEVFEKIEDEEVEHEEEVRLC